MSEELRVRSGEPEEVQGAGRREQASTSFTVLETDKSKVLAFPCPPVMLGDMLAPGRAGMELRDFFAAFLAPTELCRANMVDNIEDRFKRAYELADLMCDIRKLPVDYSQEGAE